MPVRNNFFFHVRLGNYDPCKGKYVPQERHVIRKNCVDVAIAKAIKLLNIA